MKLKQLFFVGLAALALLPACGDDADMALSNDSSPNVQNGGTVVTITACMDAQDQLSKVSMAQDGSSLDLISKWQRDDQIQMFVRQGTECFNLGKMGVDNISADGKSCSFNVVLPSEIDASSYFQLYGFTGVEAVLSNGEIMFDASATRQPLSNFRTPMMFAGNASSSDLTAGVKVSFKHFGAYELLHVANNTSSAISFSHNGFSTENRWYYGRFRCTVDKGGKVSAEDIGGYQYSEAVNIPAGRMGTIISWYIPNGKPIAQAYLEASVNGYGKRSVNAKTSSTVISAGKAYHLYASWNGDELRISDQITVNAASSVSAAEVADHIKSLPAGEYTITVEGACAADVIPSAMKANSKAIINLNLRNCETTPSFAGVTSLRSVILPANTSSVIASAFNGCTALESVEMFDEVEVIDTKAFYGCTALKTIRMSPAVKEINSEAFYDCRNLTNLELPAKVSKIGTRAFAHCDNISISIAKTDCWKYTTDSKNWASRANGKSMPDQLSQTWLVDNNMYYYYRGIDVTVTDGNGTKTININGVDIEFILVKGGTFWMGAQKDDPDGQNYDENAQDIEAPVHQVTLDDYYIGKYEITRAQWKAVMGGVIEDDDYKYPQGNISWNACHDFINRVNELSGVNISLPTESEWEFAARGGNSDKEGLYAGMEPWFKDNNAGQLQPVGYQYRRNELGLYDMSGNCWEFVSDAYSSYPSEHLNNPLGTGGEHRVLRGGGAGCSASDCRVSHRGEYVNSYYWGSHFNDNTSWDYGFRLAIRP